MNKNKFIIYWLWTGLIMVVTMVIIGGITRLTNSGLSMVDWKLIAGAIPPLTAESWEQTFEQYKQFPEYQKLNYNMTLGAFKSIFWWEYLHRLLGRTIGLVFIIPFIFFWIKKWLDKQLMVRLMVIFVLGGFQGFLGWYMVKSGLVDVPHVSHFRLAIHLSAALVLFCAILWTILGLRDEFTRDRWRPRLFFPYATLGLLFFQIVLGAFVAGLKAGYGYNNFPFMGETVLPTADMISIAPPFSNGPVVQFIHRWMAFVVLFAMGALYKISQTEASTKRLGKWLLVVAGVQVALGIATLMLAVPVVLGVLHQLVAVILLGLLLAIVFHLHHSSVSTMPKIGSM
ncbi:MAG: COX15/CtaA family protein [Cyclobacteriaceae bacterium]